MGLTKTQRRDRIRKRIRKTIFGTALEPRLSVFRSNNQIYAQLIDDKNGTTLATASSREKAVSGSSRIENSAIKELVLTDSIEASNEVKNTKNIRKS